MILLIDNFDSFVANLARYFRRLGFETKVVLNDRIDIQQVEELKPEAIVISPGPCTPAEAGISCEIVHAFSGKIPILGICLGHQVIGATHGAKIVRANEPVHGRPSTIHHDGHFLFNRVPQKFEACRYHSLVIDEDSLPANLSIICRTADQTIMGVADDEKSLYGLQFHPESILTPFGFRILDNFMQRINRAARTSFENENQLFASETGGAARMDGAVDDQSHQSTQVDLGLSSPLKLSSSP